MYWRGEGYFVLKSRCCVKEITISIEDVGSSLMSNDAVHIGM
jgi:hypothetical protein